MSVQSKGWYGGDGSMADAAFENMWGARDGFPLNQEITEGPLATFPPGYDPTTEKVALMIGSDNNPSSSASPGGNRMIQEPQQHDLVQQKPQDAVGTAPANEAKNRAEGSPTKGSKGGELLKRIRARRAEKGDVVGEETSTKSVGGDAQAQKHNLNVKEPAPVPKEMTPQGRKGNLAAYHEQSAWTGSGPQAALHDDYSKVGALLKLAGVPERELSNESVLVRMALMVKESSGPEYLARNDVHPLKLVAELEDTLGDEWPTWEPETIRETIVKEAGITPSDDVMSKVMAVKIVLARPDIFYDNWEAMEKIAVALNDRSPIMGAVEEVPVEWLSNAVTIVEKLAGEGDFGPETTKYVAARLYDQGYAIAPPLLRFADEELGGMVNNDDLRRKVILAYAKSLDAKGLDEGEDPISIQVGRLLRNNAYVLDRLSESRSQLE